MLSWGKNPLTNPKECDTIKTQRMKEVNQMYIYVVIQDGPFHKTPICFYYTEEGAEACVQRMNANSHYKYYWEEIEQGG